MKKNNLLDFLIIVLVYIGLSCFPFSLIIKDDKLSWLILVLQMVIQIGLFVFIILFVKFKTSLNHRIHNINYINTLFLFPTLVVCFSNLINLIVAKETISVTVDLDLFLNILLTIFIVTNEEIIFRLLFINNLEIENKLLVIVVTALVFGLCHITHFLTTFNPSDLLIILYTFLLGLLLGFSYLFTKSIYPCIFIHFLFNLFQEILFPYFVLNWIYIFITSAFVIFAMVYGVIMFLFKKDNLKVEETQ